MPHQTEHECNSGIHYTYELELKTIEVSLCRKTRLWECCARYLLKTCAVTIRDGKSNKNRQSILNHNLIAPLTELIGEALEIQRTDNAV